MTQQLFIAVTDDMLFNHPEQIEGPLVAYFTGMECHHWLSVELNPETPAPGTKGSVQSELISSVVNKVKQHQNNQQLTLAYSR